MCFAGSIPNTISLAIVEKFEFWTYEIFLAVLSIFSFWPCWYMAKYLDSQDVSKFKILDKSEPQNHITNTDE